MLQEVLEILTGVVQEQGSAVEALVWEQHQGHSNSREMFSHALQLVQDAHMTAFVSTIMPSGKPGPYLEIFDESTQTSSPLLVQYYLFSYV